MRPVQLTLSEIRSYPGACTIDFTGKQPVGILGDTGAGKSTLLEAIVFALYGRSSWAAANGRELISTGLDEMSMAFEFSVDDEAPPPVPAEELLRAALKNTWTETS
jgi:DNA repair protein SbcC/Rad50